MFLEWKAKLKMRGKLIKLFKDGEICKTFKTGNKTYTIYPKIHETFLDTKNECIRFTFTLPNGVDPELVLNKEWLWKQTFGKYVEITGKYKKFIVNVYMRGLDKIIPYKYDEIEPHLQGKQLPIVTGKDVKGQLNVLDMMAELHLLLTGSTGSGKSSLIRSILVTLIKHKQPEDLRLILCDLKASEFGVFRRCAHVEDVLMSEETVLTALRKVEREIERRGKLLDKYDVENVAELEEKLPYIIVCIDEVILLKDNRKIMNILEKISCIGRSNHVLLLLSLQRGDSRNLGGQLKNNLTFRISGKQSDEVNAKISGLKRSTNLDDAGRMVLATSDGEKEIQVPYMKKQEAKKLLEPYKIRIEEKDPNKDIESELNIESQQDTNFLEDVFSDEEL